MKAINVTRDTELAGTLLMATGLFSRMKGLLGKKTLPAGEGLWIKPCKSIHTIGMKFPIDVIFIDSQNMVVATLPSIGPGRLSPFYAAASSVIELPVGTIQHSSTQPGDTIVIS